MKLLSIVSPALSDQINSQFPELFNLHWHQGETKMERIAISVFDHWLVDESEWHLKECYEGPERINRDKKFEFHWQAVFALAPIYTIRSRGCWPHKSKRFLKKYLDRTGFLQQCHFDKQNAPSQFIVIPEYDCIYAASWDDTNVLFYHSREKAEPIIDLASRAGLFTLEFTGL